MTRNIALIPARSGSKGIKNKNIKKICGRSLLEWSIKAALKSKQVHKVIVSTDSKEYAKYAIEAGAEVPFLRPKEISLDNSTDYEFIEHALDWLSKNDEMPDFIVHLRPTTPLRDPLIIDSAINIFRESQNRTSLRSVHEMSESSYKNFEINKSGKLVPLGLNNVSIDSLNNARQLFPKTYIANGYVDVLCVDHIISTHSIHGESVLPFLTPSTCEVDSLDDFEYINFQVSRNPQFFSNLFIEK